MKLNVVDIISQEYRTQFLILPIGLWVCKTVVIDNWEKGARDSDLVNFRLEFRIVSKT